LIFITNSVRKSAPEKRRRDGPPVCGSSPASVASLFERLGLGSGAHENPAANDSVMREEADGGPLGSKKSRLFRSETRVMQEKVALRPLTGE
jgi:hypothetical protein